MAMSNGENVEWTEEELYFGNACTPSWEIYRSSSDRLQVRAERGLQLRLTDDGKDYVADLSDAPEFMAKYSDCQLLVMKGYPDDDSGIPVPSLYLIGWQEITDDAGRHRYERDKRSAWRKPNQP